MEINSSVVVIISTAISAVIGLSLIILLIVDKIKSRNKVILEESLEDLNLAAFTDSLQIGQYLVRNSENNPFVEYTTKIKIYGIKDGWVKYKYVYDNFSDELNDIVEFSYSKISDLYRINYKQLK